MQTLYIEENQRSNNLDLIRFLLAASVVFTHSFLIYTGKINLDLLYRLSNHQLTLGTAAVNFFFVISGFLIAQSWHNSKSFTNFLKKRVLRIYPGFIAVSLFCAFIVAPLGIGTITHPRYIIGYWEYINLPSVLSDILKLGELSLPKTFKTLPVSNVVNASVWSISYEFLCYLIIPFLALWKKRFFPLAIFFFVLAINIYDYNVYHIDGAPALLKNWHIPGQFAAFFTYKKLNFIVTLEHLVYPFMAGVCFYVYRKYIIRSVYLAVFSFILVVYTLCLGSYFELVQAIFGAYLLFYFAFNQTIKFGDFARYGDFSYGVYLYGWPVQQLIMLYVGYKLTVLEHFALSMVFIIPLAALSWYFVEKPFLRLKNTRFGWSTWGLKKIKWG